MRFGFQVPNFGAFSDVRAVAGLAERAESAGWDGFFLWDHIDHQQEPCSDPWIMLSAIALQTDTIRLGPMVTPLPRRHLGKLAREISTLDHLSGGRVIFGCGAGGTNLPEATAFGEPADPRDRATMLEEGLEVLTQWWAEGPVDVDGTFVTAHIDVHGPTHQLPRAPIWLAATWPNRRPVRRAARWDGLFPITTDALQGGITTPEDIAAMATLIAEHRTATGPFDIVHSRASVLGGTPEDAAAYADAGATWWVAGAAPFETLDDAARYIDKGPPR